MFSDELRLAVPLRFEDEQLHRQVWIVVDLAHICDHLAAERLLDHLGELTLHGPLKAPPDLEHGLNVVLVDQGSLDRGEAPLEYADHSVVDRVCLCPGGAFPVEATV